MRYGVSPRWTQIYLKTRVSTHLFVSHLTTSLFPFQLVSKRRSKRRLTVTTSGEDSELPTSPKITRQTRTIPTCAGLHYIVLPRFLWLYLVTLPSCFSVCNADQSAFCSLNLMRATTFPRSRTRTLNGAPVSQETKLVIKLEVINVYGLPHWSHSVS